MRMPVQNIRAGPHTVFWHLTYLDDETFTWKVECTCEHEEARRDLFSAMEAGSKHATLHGWVPRPVGHTTHSATIHIRKDPLSKESLCGLAHLVCSVEPWGKPDCSSCLSKEDTKYVDS